MKKQSWVVHTKRVWVFYTQINRGPRHRVALSNTVVFVWLSSYYGPSGDFPRGSISAGQEGDWQRRAPKLSLQAMLSARRSLCKLLLLRFRVCKNLCKDPQAPWAACIEPSRFHSGSVRSPRFQCLAYKLRKILMSWFAIRVACQSGSDAAACLHERSWRQPDG